LQSYTESDPTVPSHVKGITTTDISNWNSKQNALTFDSTPTAGSTNPVTSAGIKAYVDNATPTITMDDTPTSGSSNPVKSSGIYNALQGKQNTLTFDSTPIASSTNPVTSGGVKIALDLKANQSTTYTKTEVDALFDDVAYLGDDDGQATTLDFDPQADTVWNKAQTLGSAQQAQARNNIGAVGSVTVNGTTYTPTNGNVDLGIISGGGSGDVNVIKTVKVNGTALVPDANRAVNVSVPTKVSDLANDAGYTTETSVINHGTSDTTFALTPNLLHIWGEVTALTLTLATPTDSTIVNEYMFQFTSGTTATTLSLPSSVTWVAAPSINAGATYQVSIVNNLGVIAEFSETT